MKAPRLDLKCQGERDLEHLLLENAQLRSEIDRLEQRAELGARRHLLATSVRLMPGMAPRLNSLVAFCQDALGVSSEIETYVYPDASFNAACVRPEDGRVFILLSSALLEGFDEQELRFVIGHELGHHLFAHHRIPVKLLTGEGHALPGPVVMQLFAWSRYAELSADRAGLVCAGELAPVSRALFKLASGLRAGVVEVGTDELLDQVAALRDELKRGSTHARADWFATHPFSPFRLHAALYFAKSLEAGAPTAVLEARVGEVMALMEPSYLEDKNEHAELMRRLLLAGGVSVAAASGDIEPKEREALERFFGAAVASNANVRALKGDLDRRAREVQRLPLVRRQQVLRDLCLIARADEHVSDEEKAVLFSIADAAQVDRAFLERSLALRCELD